MRGNQKGPVEGELDGQKPTAYVLQGQVEGARMAGSRKEEVKGQSNCSLQLLKGSYKDDGAKHTFVRPGDIARSHGQELQFGRFSSDIRKSLLISSSVGKGQQVSIIGDFQSLARESHSRPDLTAIAWLRVGVWTLQRALPTSTSRILGFGHAKPCPQRGLCHCLVSRKGFQHRVRLRTKEFLGNCALTNIDVGHHAGRAVPSIQKIHPRASSPNAVRKANTRAQDRNVWKCLLPSSVSLPGTLTVIPTLRSSLVSPSTAAPELTGTTTYSHQAWTQALRAPSLLLHHCYA